ncbi:MAG TPA: hypothetical protein VIV60_33615 [Polyangiaceae bacterium]
MRGKGPTLVIAAPVLGGGGKRPSPGEPSQGSGSDDEMGIMAMQRMMAAMQAGKPRAAWEAFKAAKEACYGGSMMGGSEPDYDEG